MWNFKHLIIAILFAVCAGVCAFAAIFSDGGNFTAFGFLSGGASSNFAPVGAAIFAFFSVIFFRNSRR